MLKSSKTTKQLVDAFEKRNDVDYLQLGLTITRNFMQLESYYKSSPYIVV